MAEGMPDLQNPDQRNPDMQNPDQGGGGTAGTPPVVPPVTPPGGGTLMHCTLPLAVGLSSEPGQAQSRIDWKQFQTSPLLALLLLDANGVPMNLAGALSVTLRMAPIFGGTLITEALSALYAAGGMFGYAPQAEDVASSGTFQFDIEAVDAGGNVLYFPSDGTVLFVIHPSLGGP